MPAPSDETTHSPLPPRDAALTSAARAGVRVPSSTLEVALFWEDHLLSVTPHRRHAVTVGEAPHNDYPLSHACLPAPSFPIFARHEDAWHLVVFQGLTGEIVREDGRAHTLDALLNEESLTPHPGGSGAWLVALRVGDEVSLHFGASILHARLAPTLERTERHGRIDRAPFPYITLSATLHIGFLLLTLAAPVVDSAPLTVHPPAMPATDRFVQAEVVSPTPTPPPKDLPEGLDYMGDAHDDALGVRHRHKEGSAGAREAKPSASKRLSIADRDVRPPSIGARQTSRQLGGVDRAGALAVLSGDSRLLGDEDRHDGDSDATEHIGQLADAARGEEHGAEGLGISGTGRGAGAHAEASVGLSHTLGVHRSGLGGRGVAPRLEERAREVDDLFMRHRAAGDEEEVGCLTKDMVRSAIKRRRNQLRTCYEGAMLRHRDLRGSIEVQLTIGQIGGVTDFAILRDTIDDDGVAACIESKLKTLRFPSFDQCDKVVVTYPFNFHPKQLLLTF